MSPSSHEINGPRPAPLKIHKDSHQIQKTTSSTATTAAAASYQQRQQPIIIYTHSPKVIHTQARDFMALVQKLTGLSRAIKDDDNTEDDDDDNNDSNNKKSELKPKTSPPPPPPPPGKRTRAAREQPGHLPEHDDMVNPAAATFFGFDYQPFGNIAEIPMFTPSSMDHFFCSPKSLYRYSLPEF